MQHNRHTELLQLSATDCRHPEVKARMCNYTDCSLLFRQNDDVNWIRGGRSFQRADQLIDRKTCEINYISMNRTTAAMVYSCIFG